MKAQEAIRTLKMEMLGDSEQMKCAKQIAIEALEKQMPKEPIKKYDCKNCIHDEICPVWDDYNDEPCKDGYRGFCHNYDKFKDKSQYVKLPCKVGDKAYYISVKGYSPLSYKLVKVKIIGFSINRSGIYDVEHKTLESNFTFTRHISEVYFDKSKAEAKLKELNNEQD